MANPFRKEQLRKAFRVSLLNNTYPPLHGIRFLIAFIIVGYHVRPWPNRAIAHVWFGMDVLFVMSGFLIGLILLHTFARGRGGVLRFYLRRGFRTFPLYYVILSFAAVTLPLEPADYGLMWREFAYLTNYYKLYTGHYVMFWGWSLAVEEHFYLAIPLLMLALGKVKGHRAKFGIFFAVFVGIFAWRLFYLASFPPEEAEAAHDRMYYSTHFRFDELVYGILGAYLTFHFPGELKAYLNRQLVKRATLGIIAACFFTCFLTPRFGPLTAFGFTAAGIGYTALTLYVLNVETTFARFLSRRVFLYFASLTYGLYLVHIYVLRYLVQPAAESWLGFASDDASLSAWTIKWMGTFFASLAVSYLTHVAIEKPALMLRDRLT